jgi:hypothetical protein
MCFLSGDYLEICKREFKKIVDLGAAGMLFDECFAHSSLCCFDTSHGHRYGAPVYSGDEALISAFSEILAGREFLFAGEILYDFQYNYYHLGYRRTSNRAHKGVARFIRPNCAIMTAVTGFNDRNMVNQCLLNRYIISYEPYNFKGFPSDFPLTTAYGARMDALRTELREYFWDGEFRGKLGGCVKLNGGEDYPYYSVFAGTNGKTGMVICNYDNESVTVKPWFENGEPENYHLIDGASEEKIKGGFVSIPARSAAVVW